MEQTLAEIQSKIEELRALRVEQSQGMNRADDIYAAIQDIRILQSQMDVQVNAAIRSTEVK